MQLKGSDKHAIYIRNVVSVCNFFGSDYNIPTNIKWVEMNVHADVSRHQRMNPVDNGYLWPLFNGATLKLIINLSKT